MADQEDKDQKTEEATPRRRAEARDRGQVAMSTEFIAALALCTGGMTFLLAGPGLAEALAGQISATVRALSSLGTGDLTIDSAAALIDTSLTTALGPLGLVVGPTLLVATLTGYAQVGFKLAPKALEPDLSKLNVVKGMGRLFGMRSFVRTLMAAAKVSAITTVVAVIAAQQIGQVVRMSDNELGPLLVGLVHIAVRCTGGALIVILALAVLDLAYQRWQHSKDLRMSKQEVKEDHKLSDGDPHVRGRIRQMQRELATRRMMDDVPEATVVVTNPTHYSVALKYERDEAGQPQQNAPVVVAKGVDFLALRIREVAREAGVPLYEDVPLARALYAQVDLGQEIPEDLYAAAAAVIGFVLRSRDDQLQRTAPAGA